MTSISENAEIAVLREQSKQLKQTLDEVRLDVKEIKDGVVNNFVTKEEFMAFKSLWWVTHSLTAVVAGLAVELIRYFFIHR